MVESEQLLDVAIGLREEFLERAIDLWTQQKNRD